MRAVLTALPVATTLLTLRSFGASQRTAGFLAARLKPVARFMGVLVNRTFSSGVSTALAMMAILSCSDLPTEPNALEVDDLSAAATAPGTVSDLSVSAIGTNSVTLSFTQVDDGTGNPAKYDVRYARAPISWGSAPSVTSGTCTTPVVGTGIGSRLTCTVLGLSASTNYNFQLVPYRGTLNMNAVFGGLSNIAAATTTAEAPPAPTAPGTVSDLSV